MHIVVEPFSSTPPYEQIRDQITTQARGGTLAAGTRLPTIRHLADDLRLAPGTVARAYKELEADRVIETRGRHGTFISAGPSAASREAFAAATEYVARVRRLGLDLSAAVDEVDKAFAAVTAAGAAVDAESAAAAPAADTAPTPGDRA